MRELSWMGKTIGYYAGGTFVIYKNESQIFQRFKSFGLSVEVIEKLDKLNIKTIVFRFQNSVGRKTKFVTSLKNYKRSEFEYDDDGDLQKHVPIEDMTEITDEEMPMTKEWLDSTILNVQKRLLRPDISYIRKRRLENFLQRLRNMKRFGRI